MSQRIESLPPGEWPAEMRDALAALTPPNPRHPLPERDPNRPKALNALGVLAQHVELTHAYHVFNGHVQFATTLSARERELLILRVAAVRGAAYEWAQHAVLAADAGVDDGDLARVRVGGDAEGWSPREAAMICAVDELVVDADISDPTWAALAAELDVRQIMDLVFTVGAYDLLAMAFGAFRLELDDDLQGGNQLL